MGDNLFSLVRNQVGMNYFTSSHVLSWMQVASISFFLFSAWNRETSSVLYYVVAS